MKFVIEIDCDNAAFKNRTFTEVASILDEISENMKYWADDDPKPSYDAKLFDVNGNTVGIAKIV